MKIKILKEEEIDLVFLVVDARVRYWEDATVNGVEDTEGSLIPCRVGDSWCPKIHIDSGVIINWKKGIKASIHYKVCDAGTYMLTDLDGDVIYDRHEEYVPKAMCPKENGYGDYIIMDIDEEGRIANWNPLLCQNLEE